MPTAGTPPLSDPPAPRVLVVEDNPDTASLITATINRAFPGTHCTLAPNLAAMREHALTAFDLVLCDHNLPDGTSLDAIAHITKLRDDLPVVVVTGERAAAVAAQAIRAGASDYLPKSTDFLSLLPVIVAKNLEAAKVRSDNHRLQAALASSLAELKRKNKELALSADRYKSLAATDSLTGLANRRVLDERLIHMFAEAQRYEHALTCLMIDLDGFKGVNDTLGHRLGDQMLELVGKLINNGIRTTDLGARYGGDEFAILMPHTDPRDAAQLAERLQKKFEHGARAIAKCDTDCSLSVGIASTANNPLAQPWELLAQADFALYQAKTNDTIHIMLCEPGGQTATPYNSEAA